MISDLQEFPGSSELEGFRDKRNRRINVIYNYLWKVLCLYSLNEKQELVSVPLT